ncbi:MAG: 3'-5' exonuclease [Candidatus Micrarchaeota archaeon]|nr:3'-5' exonuclease [Candidatus Micrarchaeota archaeon]
MKMFDGVAVVDVEATGLDSRRCSIVSVGIVLYKDRNIIEQYFECKPFKDAFIDPEGLKINGTKRSELYSENRMNQKKMMTEIARILKAYKIHTIAGQNTSFDRDFLTEAARREGVKWDLTHRTVDLHSICYALLLERGKRIPTKHGRNWLSASAMYRLLGMPTEPKPHNALTGARMEFEAMSRLVYGKSVLNDFKRFRVNGFHL